MTMAVEIDDLIEAAKDVAEYADETGLFTGTLDLTALMHAVIAVRKAALRPSPSSDERVKVKADDLSRAWDIINDNMDDAGSMNTGGLADDMALAFDAIRHGETLKNG